VVGTVESIFSDYLWPSRNVIYLEFVGLQHKSDWRVYQS